MNRFFRETDRVFAREVRWFVHRYRPLAEMFLTRLDDASRQTPNGRGGVLAEDVAFMRKLAALKVKFEALRALESRMLAQTDASVPPGALAAALAVRCAELCVAANSLLIEALGYYALPAPGEYPGDNQAPLGGGYALPAIPGMLTDLFGYPGSLDSLKDQLARWLLEGASPGAGR